MKVLLVDDTKTLTTIIKIYLMGWGMEFHEARDGVEGLSAVRSLRPDLVISDIKMPRMSGLELCSVIRADPALARTPVVLLTHLGDQATRDQGRAVGATAFLTKPVAVEDLREVVAKTLGLSVA